MAEVDSNLLYAHIAAVFRTENGLLTRPDSIAHVTLAKGWTNDTLREVVKKLLPHRRILMDMFPEKFTCTDDPTNQKWFAAKKKCFLDAHMFLATEIFNKHHPLKEEIPYWLQKDAKKKSRERFRRSG